MLICLYKDTIFKDLSLSLHPNLKTFLYGQGIGKPFQKPSKQSYTAYGGYCTLRDPLFSVERDGGEGHQYFRIVLF